MMKFDELMGVVRDANPQIESGRVSMSAESFEKALRFAFDKGRESGVGEATFNELFGGGR